MVDYIVKCVLRTGEQLLQITWLFTGQFVGIGQLIVKTIFSTDVQPVVFCTFQESSDGWMELCNKGYAFFNSILDGITCQGVGSYDM